MQPLEPISYDYQGLIAAKGSPPIVRHTGLTEADLRWLQPRLESVRREVFDELAFFNRGGTPPEDMMPLQPGFIDFPEKLLSEDRPLLEQTLAAADALAREVDRVVILGIGGSYMGARALFEACCHPYHNELSRQHRGGRPRIYFAGDNLDNDAAQGLLDLLEGNDDWGIVVISKSGETLETAVAFRIFFDMLRKSCREDAEKIRRRLIVITGKSGRLRKLAGALGCDTVLPVPEGVGGRFSVLSPVGLLPAAVMGLDISHLLEGAAAINQRFRSAQPLENPVLAYAGLSWLMECRRGAMIRVLATWGKGLEAVGFWYDQLLAESLGKEGLGPTPLTVVNTRDLHSRGQQHQEGRRDKLITNLFVEHTHRQWLTIEPWEQDEDGLNAMSGKSLPDFLRAAFSGVNQAYAEDYRRTATITLPRQDEGSLGQLFQMLMLATVVEGRLRGVNPYGQPGVEAYKKHMHAILKTP